MQKIRLNQRKSVEIDIGEEEPTVITYLAKTGKQTKEEADLFDSNVAVFTFNKLREKHFWENIKADEKVLKALKAHFDENGGLFEFINSCEVALGKQSSNA